MQGKNVNFQQQWEIHWLKATFIVCIRCVFQLVVEHEEVRLYMDCGEAERATFHRRPDRLAFSHNSGIFVSNAGNTGLDNFVVSKEVLWTKVCLWVSLYVLEDEEKEKEWNWLPVSISVWIFGCVVGPSMTFVCGVCV